MFFLENCNFNFILFSIHYSVTRKFEAGFSTSNLFAVLSSLGQIIQPEQHAFYVLIQIVDKNAGLESFMQSGIFII